MTDLSDHDEMELSTDNEEVRASTRDAADGLREAKDNRKLSNKAIGNNQISQHSNRSMFGKIQRMTREGSTYN